MLGRHWRDRGCLGILLLVLIQLWGAASKPQESSTALIHIWRQLQEKKRGHKAERQGAIQNYKYTYATDLRSDSRWRSDKRAYNLKGLGPTTV